MIKAIFFDLDNCLAAADETGRGHFAPMYAAVRAANRGALDDARLEAAFEDTWVHAFDFVARRHGFTDAMFQAGFAALRDCEVAAPMRGYGDLHVLPELPCRRFLVTSGFRRLQASKVRMLGIGAWFERILVDAVDDPPRPGKQALFERLLAETGLAPAEVLAVGDNPDSEIEAGNRLGIATVQTLRPGVIPSPKAGRHIAGLEELKALLGP